MGLKEIRKRRRKRLEKKLSETYEILDGWEELMLFGDPTEHFKARKKVSKLRLIAEDLEIEIEKLKRKD